jgi:hypothetical protein
MRYPTCRRTTKAITTHTITFSAIGAVDINSQVTEPFTATSPVKNTTATSYPSNEEMVTALSTALENLCIEDDAENHNHKGNPKTQFERIGMGGPWFGGGSRREDHWK